MTTQENGGAPPLTDRRDATGRAAPEPAPAPGGLSYAQERMWFLHLMDPDSPAYNITSVVRLRGPVDGGRLAGAFRALLARHPMLRSRFVSRPDGSAVRQTLPLADVDTPLAVVGADSGADTETVVRATLLAPFDLGAAPLLRAVLVSESAQSHTLAMVVHHIVADGWTLGILHRDLRELYQRRAAPTPLAEVDGAGLDALVTAERRWVASAAGRDSLDYWRRQLADLTPIELPMARPRPPVARFVGRRRELHVSEELTTALEALGRQHRCSLYTVMVAAFATLLHRYSGQTDIVFGSPVANRTSTEVAGTVGLFVNTVVVRVDAAHDPSFAELLGKTRRTVLDALQHQRMPFELVVDALQPERTLSQNPLFQVMIAHQNMDIGHLGLADTVVEPVNSDIDVARADIECTTWRLDDGIRVRLNVAEDLIDGAVAERMLGEFLSLLQGVLRRPTAPISTLPVFERADPTAAAGHTAPPPLAPPPDLWTWFDRVSHLRGDAPAVSDAEQCLTFRQLRERAAAVRDHLRWLGVQPGDRVALVMGPTTASVAAIFGVVATGAVFVPINPEDPRERIDFVVADAGARVCLTDESVAALPDGTADVDHAVATADDRPAYVIYTSGTTGRPKGVVVAHANVINTLLGCQQEFGIDADDVGLVLASVTFDVHYYELLSVLLAGGHARLVSKAEMFTPERIVPLLTSASRLQAVTGLMEHLLTTLDSVGVTTVPGMRQVITGGDVVPPPLLDRLRSVFDKADVAVTYGPTEAAIFATHYHAVPGVHGYPIGRPLPGVSIVVADDNGVALPPGVTGEIWIGGQGVAVGYLNRPDETAQRFVDRAGARFYRTGDRGRWLPEDGCLEFRGRADTQVKIRGFRIELGEVETVLTSLDRVRHGVVAKVTDGPSDSRLVAYAVVEPDTEPSATDETGHVRDWQALFDQTHRSKADEVRDFTGWNSSYDGRPMPVAEMDEWVTETVDRVRDVLRTVGRARRNRPKVLEIGCGTGLLATELAGDCETYVGLDFSAEALAVAAAAARRRGIGNLRLLTRDAADLTGLPGDFDLVVVNSVAQYFPSLHYLDDVLAGAAGVLAPDGAIFCGDVRSLPLLGVFHASVLAAAAPADVQAGRLAARVRGESELVIDPRYFLRRFTSVDAAPKFGAAVNELTKFRYDVTAWPGAVPDAEVDWLDWAPDGSPDWLRAVLARRPEHIGLRDVRNARVAEDVALHDRIRQPDGQPNVAGAGLTTDELREIAAAHGYRVRTSWLAAHQDGAFDALLLPAGRRHLHVRWPGEPAAPATELATRPGDNRRRAEEAARIRRGLATRLPGYMVPDTVLVVDELPLTQNGKVDRAALPAAPPPQGAGRPPAAGTERVVADVWADVIGTSAVSATDDFFQIGGTSLTAIRAAVALREHGMSISPQLLFECPTVTRLAEAIDRVGASARPAVIRPRPSRPARPEPSAPTGRQPEDEWRARTRLLLTGATGFLGAHLLAHALRTYPDLAIDCLVRAQDQDAARERLWRSHSWYHPAATADARREFEDRVTAVPGDLRVDDLGLSEQRSRRLAATVQAVVHAGADVRHVAPRQEIYQANLRGTNSIARLCELAGGIRLVHVSTIGVAGRCAADQELSLTEADLEIGQTPTEDYSASKIDAERALRDTALFDSAVSVMRVGTVAPHATTGRFQRNIDGHFFSRYLRAALVLGVVPDWPGREFRPIPADAMADAIFRLSGAASARGRTFHVQTDHTLPHAAIARHAAELGYPMAVLPVERFIETVTGWGTDPDRAEDVGRLLPWLARPADRAVHLDTGWTDRTLAALGFRYPPPDGAWLGRFVEHGVSVGYFPAPPGDRR